MAAVKKNLAGPPRLLSGEAELFFGLSMEKLKIENYLFSVSLTI